MIIMKRLFTQENIYTIVWCLYYMQGTLYPEGSAISQGLLALFLLMSVYYVSKVLQMLYKHKVIKAFLYLALMFGIYGLLRLGAETTGWLRINSATDYFKEYEISILPVFAFYYFAMTKRINGQWFYNMSFLFLLTACASFFYQEAQALLITWRGETTNNAGYFVLSLMPVVVFLRKKPLVQYAFLLVIFYLVVCGMKRGAIVGAILGCGYFVWKSYSSAKGTRKILYILLGVGAIIASVMYFEYQLATSDYMQLRLEQTKSGDMSERENMYPEYLDYYFSHASIVEYLFGYGADGTLKNMGDFAHQDWIETLMNQGLLGIILLLNYWVTIIFVTIKCYIKRYSNITLILALFIIIYFIKSMVSMSINGMTLFSTSALAYALAAIDNRSIRKDLTD